MSEALLYRRIRSYLIGLILDGATEQEPLPSVRNLAAHFSANPLTAAKAYRVLLDCDHVTVRKGVGFFVKPNARGRLLAAERARFLEEEWPQIAEKLRLLKIDGSDLLAIVSAAFLPSHQFHTVETPEGRSPGVDVTPAG